MDSKANYKVFSDVKNKVTVAVVYNEPDMLFNTALRRFVGGEDDVFSLKELMMPKENKGTVRCDAQDTYDVKVGEQEALKKADTNLRQSITRAFTRWQVKMLKRVYTVSPYTFREALNQVDAWVDKVDQLSQ